MSQALFKNKKITLMGLGLLGRGVNVATFLASCGAELVVTDLKNEQQLAPSLEKLEAFSHITYRLGGHNLADFRDTDMVIKAAGVPFDSPFIAEAKKHSIPVEMDASLFARLTEATIIGITGTRGKSTTTHLIHHLLKHAGVRTHLGGNVRGRATLPLLAQARRGEYVVLELDSWQLQGFGDAHISPHIAVFTNFLPDHQNYYHGDMQRYFLDKANIFAYQDATDHLVISANANATIHERSPEAPRAQTHIVPPLHAEQPLTILGAHNRLNAGLAKAVGEILDIPQTVIDEALASFDGVPGRLQQIYKKHGLTVYNDTTATTPEATAAGITALIETHPHKPLTVIAGGTDKELDFAPLVKTIQENIPPHRLVLVGGSGTDKLIVALKEQGYFKAHAPQLFDTLEDAVYTAFRSTVSTPRAILFSPASASFEKFKNEFDRGEQFNNLVMEVTSVDRNRRNF